MGWSEYSQGVLGALVRHNGSPQESVDHLRQFMLITETSEADVLSRIASGIAFRAAASPRTLEGLLRGRLAEHWDGVRAHSR